MRRLRQGKRSTLVNRLHQAVDLLSQATVEKFVGLYTQTIADQAERLDQFTRMAAHEWRQPLGALQFGVRLLREADLDPAAVERTLANVERNVLHLADLTRKMEAIARVRSNGDNAVIQTISVATVAQEAARQLREMADARGVEIRVAETLPVLTVDVGRLELAFVNLLSNAIRVLGSGQSGAIRRGHRLRRRRNGPDRGARQRSGNPRGGAPQDLRAVHARPRRPD